MTTGLLHNKFDAQQVCCPIDFGPSIVAADVPSGKWQLLDTPAEASATSNHLYGSGAERLISN